MKAIVIPTNTNTNYKHLYWKTFEILFIGSKTVFLSVPNGEFSNRETAFSFAEIAIVNADNKLKEFNDYMLNDEYKQLTEQRRLLIETKTNNLYLYCQSKQLI